MRAGKSADRIASKDWLGMSELTRGLLDQCYDGNVRADKRIAGSLSIRNKHRGGLCRSRSLYSK